VQSDPINAKDSSGLCPDDYKNCKDRFLRNYFGDIWAHGIVPMFSLGNLVPHATDFSYTKEEAESRNEYVKIALEKQGLISALSYASKFLAPPTGLPTSFFSAGTIWGSRATGAAALGIEIVGVAATGVTFASTTMDVLAVRECIGFFWDSMP